MSKSNRYQFNMVYNLFTSRFPGYMLFFTLSCITLLLLPSTDSEAISPSFVRQEITDDDPSPDWSYSPLFPGANCSVVKLHSYVPDIEGVSYFSDGNSLNATIWLSSSFEEKPKFVRAPTYSMLIGIIQPFEANLKVNYATSVSWDLMNQAWIKKTEEFFGNNSSRIIEQRTIQNFSDNSGNKGKINLSLDLHRLNFPPKYFVLFSAIDLGIAKGNACMLIDFIDRSLFIPPDFRIATFPSQLQINQGEEKNFLIDLNSTKFIDTLVILNPDEPRGFKIDFDPNPLIVSREGRATSELKMKVSDAVQPRPYRFSVYSNISLPDKIDFSQYLESATQSLINGTQIPGSEESKRQLVNKITNNLVRDTVVTGKIMQLSPPQPFYITAIVIPYAWWKEGFSSFWNIYGDILSLIGGGFAAGFSALLIDRLKNKTKHEPQKTGM